MSGKSVRLCNWPYYHGKIAKLISISKPYWVNTQYWVKVRFFPENGVEYELPFTDLTMLIRDGDYTNGYYQEIASTNTAMLNLRFPESSKPKPYPPKERRNLEDEFESYTFGFPYMGHYYVLPLEVLVRDVLAPDGEMLHLMTSLDMKDKKFICKKENGVVRIEVMSDVPYKYSENKEKMMHIAWVFSNPKLEKMLAQAFENIRNGNGILFDWCFDRIKCEVTYQTNTKGIRFIKCITSINKKINAAEVHVDDVRDSISEGETQGESKRSKVVAKDAEELVSCGKGKTGDLGQWAPNPVVVTYDVLPKYIRKERSSRKPRTITNYKHNAIIIGDGRRTTGDYTGEKSVPKLIFKQHRCLQDDSPFSEVSSALSVLQGEEGIIKVESYLAELSLHADTGLFRYLNDGVTGRCYFAAKIIFKDGKQAVLLDLQRENRNISMLMLISKNGCEWGGFIHEIIKYMVEGSGKWPSDTLYSLRNSFFLNIDRFNHTNIGYERLAKKILSKCLQYK